MTAEIEQEVANRVTKAELEHLEREIQKLAVQRHALDARIDTMRRQKIALMDEQIAKLERGRG